MTDDRIEDELSNKTYGYESTIRNGITEESWYCYNTGNWFLRLTDYEGLCVLRKVDSLSLKCALVDIIEETRISAREELLNQKSLGQENS